MSADAALTAIGQHLAGRLGTTAQVQDLAPLAPGDPSGSIEFYITAPAARTQPADAHPRHLEMITIPI